MRHPKVQNQARDTGEPGLSPRWGFPPGLNSWRQELSPRESTVRARSCKSVWHPAGRSPPARADRSTARLGASPHEGALAQVFIAPLPNF